MFHEITLVDDVGSYFARSEINTENIIEKGDTPDEALLQFAESLIDVLPDHHTESVQIPDRRTVGEASSDHLYHKIILVDHEGQYMVVGDDTYPLRATGPTPAHAVMRYALDVGDYLVGEDAESEREPTLATHKKQNGDWVALYQTKTVDGDEKYQGHGESVPDALRSLADRIEGDAPDQSDDPGARAPDAVTSAEFRGVTRGRERHHPERGRGRGERR